MKKLERIFIIISITISLLYILVCLYEIFSVQLDSETYERIYGLNDNALHWQFKSVLRYQLWQGFNIFVASFIVFTGMKILRGSNLRIVFYTIFTVSAIWLLRYYILWNQSGYDHHPGFDPYLF